MTGQALPCFVTRPLAPPPWPGLLVIHEGNGISPQLLRVCERLADVGYATVAPDLFFRSGGSEAADYGTLIGALEPDELRADLTEAHGRLRALGADRIGITGFCLGGTITYRAARWGLDLAAAAPFYGGHIATELGPVACPLLLFFGGTDEYIPPKAIEKVRGTHPDVVVYPEAGHGFMRDGSSNYDATAAADAWARLLAFFAQHLRE